MNWILRFLPCKHRNVESLQNRLFRTVWSFVETVLDYLDFGTDRFGLSCLLYRLIWALECASEKFDGSKFMSGAHQQVRYSAASDASADVRKVCTSSALASTCLRSDRHALVYRVHIISASDSAEHSWKKVCEAPIARDVYDATIAGTCKYVRAQEHTQARTHAHTCTTVHRRRMAALW